MSLRYEFVTSERPLYRNDWDVDYDTVTQSFEYEPEYSEVRKFFNELSEPEFVDGCEHAWEQLKEENKKWFLDPKNGYALPELMNGDKFNWNAVYRDLDIKGDIISELLMDDMDYWEDELTDEFEDAARAAFDDM